MDAKELIEELEIDRAQLLLLAREAAQDGTLVSPEHLRRAAVFDLRRVLERIHYERAAVDAVEMELSNN